MPSEHLQKTGKQISFADHAGDFSPAATTDLQQGTPTDVQLSLASVADGAARQSAKFDFGAVRAAQYGIMAALELAASVVANNRLEVYLAPSPDPTAANGNPGGVSGSDAAYTGTTGSTVAESVGQLMFLGVLKTTDDATGAIQTSFGGKFAPPERYGSLVFVNNSGVAMHSDDVECHIVFTEIKDESQ